MNVEEFKKRLQFYSAVHDIVQIFGETEVGTCEIDEEAVAEYCLSLKFTADQFTCSTKEDIYQKLTDEILNGFPVWQFLKVSDWTKEMLERTFSLEQERKWKELCKKYKCYTCKYHLMKESGIGVYEECNWKPKDARLRTRVWLKDRSFAPKKSCKNYERK